MSAIPICKVARGEIIRRRFYEGGKGNLPQKTFFPADSLRAYLTDKKIKEILLCKCPGCTADLDLFRILEPDARSPQITGQYYKTSHRHNPRPAYALFALLIYVEHPLLIFGFLDDGDFYDDDLERSTTRKPFSAEDLKHYTRDFYLRNPLDFAEFAMTFQIAVTQFAIPYMDNGNFSSYSASTTLPFIEERQIGRHFEDGRYTAVGANGKVFRFKIHKEYRKFPVCSSAPLLPKLFH